MYISLCRTILVTLIFSFLLIQKLHKKCQRDICCITFIRTLNNLSAHKYILGKDSQGYNIQA